MIDDQHPSVIREQIAYYRARAPEYDEWFRREGRYDRGPEARAAWFAELEEVRQALSALPLDGASVLEIAPGTGIWTEALAARAAAVTAVDASAEMIAQNRRRLGPDAERVHYVVADVFEWRPTRRYDVVAFCFFISHVPQGRLDPFLASVAAALRPGGYVFFLDSLREETATAADHVLPGVGEEVMVRRLNDGREYRIVKNFWKPAELTARCRAVGLAVETRTTATYFVYGAGVRT